jgi:hypothetical protein
MWIGDTQAVVPAFIVSTPETDIHITVLSPTHRRHPLRLSLEGRILERAPIESVEILVASVG